MSVWNTLVSIDCTEHVEKKGQFSYLSWTWAWAMVKQNYPEADYELLPDTVFADGTMEVRVQVTIEGLSHTMWLPVLDFKNKAVQNPNAFDINSSRMRCLVKCLAMFGLGHYIYAGESMPAAPADLQEKFEALVGLLAKGDGWALRQFTIDNRDSMDRLFNMAPDGKKTKFKQDVRDLYGKTNESLRATTKALEDALAAETEDAVAVQEILDELLPQERAFVMAGLSEVVKRQVDDLIGAEA